MEVSFIFLWCFFNFFPFWGKESGICTPMRAACGVFFNNLFFFLTFLGVSGWEELYSGVWAGLAKVCIYGIVDAVSYGEMLLGLGIGGDGFG